LFVTKGSSNLITEFNRYKWKKDSAGNLLNQPVEVWNHGMDSIRYIALNMLKVRSQNSINISIVGKDGSTFRQTAAYQGGKVAIR